MTRMLFATILGIGIVLAVGCKREESDGEGRPDAKTEAHEAAPSAKQDDHGHEHADEDGHEHGEEVAEEDHAHDEVDLGTVTVGDMKVSLAQGHGKVEAGKESHLVVKLPYNDKGATVVRAWIGTKDRTASYVGKGTYAPSHDDYDIHANAPDPLPENVMWWIEMEKPDGTTVVGSAKPLLD